MYIEPCCIAKQLPPLIARHDAVFASWGDWTLADYLQQLIAHTRGRRFLTICVRRVDAFLCRQLARMIARAELAVVHIVTTENCADVVDFETKEVAARVSYAHRSNVASYGVVMGADDGTLSLIGEVNVQKDYNQHLYAFTRDSDTALWLMKMYATLLPRK